MNLAHLTPKLSQMFEGSLMRDLGAFMDILGNLTELCTVGSTSHELQKPLEPPSHHENRGPSKTTVPHIKDAIYLEQVQTKAREKKS